MMPLKFLCHLGPFHSKWTGEIDSKCCRKCANVYLLNYKESTAIHIIITFCVYSLSNCTDLQFTSVPYAIHLKQIINIHIHGTWHRIIKVLHHLHWCPFILLETQEITIDMEYTVIKQCWLSKWQKGWKMLSLSPLCFHPCDYLISDPFHKIKKSYKIGLEINIISTCSTLEKETSLTKIFLLTLLYIGNN